MIYLSKGLVCKGSTEEILEIAHYGQKFTLMGQLAHIWLNGRYEISKTRSIQEEYALKHLVRMGLAEYENEDMAVNRYRILSRCILYPTKSIRFERTKSDMEKTILLWLHKAGLRLSTAELVCLFEKKIYPREELLYEKNRQALVETLYTVETISDGILETKMEHAGERDAVVENIVKLIRKKKVVVV